MNNTLLILALLSLLAGCATDNSSSLMMGTGAGAAGLGPAPDNKTGAETVSPPRFAKSKPPVTAKIKTTHIRDENSALKAKNDDDDDFDSLQNTEVLDNPPATTNSKSKSISSSPKSDDLENFDSLQNAEILSKPSLNRYSNNKHKAIPLPPKSDDLENSDASQNTEVLNKPSLNKYANNKNKSIRAGAPASSAGNPSHYIISGESYKVLPFSNGFVERGIASWYGPDFHGEKTSNGEIYDMYGMTAAHKRLPIPSYVRVTNLKNKRSVVLRINDRGPFYADRVIDLSYTAAQKLDIHQPGTEMVQIEAIKTSNKEKVYLQLGVFSNLANAQMLRKKVAENNMPEPMVKEVRIGGKLAYRVQLGPIFSAAKVSEFNAKLAKMGISETWYVTENKIN